MIELEMFLANSLKILLLIALNVGVLTLMAVAVLGAVKFAWKGWS